MESNEFLDSEFCSEIQQLCPATIEIEQTTTEDSMLPKDLFSLWPIGMTPTIRIMADLVYSQALGKEKKKKKNLKTVCCCEWSCPYGARHTVT